MAYTINKTDGTVVATVEDGALDTSTSVKLIGRNYQSYGEPFNENLVALLENSASTTAPSTPITGELWYDKTNTILKVYNGTNFVPVGVTSSASAPTVGLTSGTLWNDTTNDQLFMYDGAAFDLIGPIFKTGDGKSGWLVDVEDLSGGGTANVLSLYQDGTRVAILTKTAVTLDSTPTGFASASLAKGITFYEDTDSTTFRLHGTAQNSLELGGREAARYLVDDQNQTTSGTFGVLNNTGLTIGAASDATLSVTDSDFIITQNNADQPILFKINQGSTVTTALTITGTADVEMPGNFTCQAVTETSSIVLKENVNPIDNALDKLVQLTGVTYDRKNGKSKNEAGLIAEEVYPVIPNVVSKDEQGNPHGINYTKLTAYLIEAVKTLKQEVDQLKARQE